MKVYFNDIPTANLKNNRTPHQLIISPHPSILTCRKCPHFVVFGDGGVWAWAVWLGRFFVCFSNAKASTGVLWMGSV
jgi:hypothetical protein